MKYTILDTSTNKILRIVECADIKIQLGKNEWCVEGHYPDNQYYHDGHKFIQIPEQPSEYHVFDNGLKQWVENKSGKANSIRNIRNKLLKESDWTQIEDNNLSDTAKDKWRAYRQQLRDMSKQSGFPDNVVFPKISEV